MCLPDFKGEHTGLPLRFTKPNPRSPFQIPGGSRLVCLSCPGQPHGVAPTVLAHDHQLAQLAPDDRAVEALDGH